MLRYTVDLCEYLFGGFTRLSWEECRVSIRTFTTCAQPNPLKDDVVGGSFLDWGDTKLIIRVFTTTAMSNGVLESPLHVQATTSRQPFLYHATCGGNFFIHVVVLTKYRQGFGTHVTSDMHNWISHQQLGDTRYPTPFIDAVSTNVFIRPGNMTTLC